MKKKYMTLAWVLTTALWAGGCSEEEEAGRHFASDHPVVFTTEVTTDGGVRGVLVNDFPDGAQVGLYGYCCDENGGYGTWTWDNKKTHCLPDKNLFDDTPMSLSGGIWNYDGLKYWYAAKDYNYSFFAYYPYQGQGIEVQTSTGSWSPQPIGDPVLAYTMPFEDGRRPSVDTELSQDNVLDVLYANRIDWRNLSDTPVPLTFAHLMTGLEFEVENYGGAPVHINNLRIQGKFHRVASVTLAKQPVVEVSDTYTGHFPVISQETTFPESTTPQKVNGSDGKPVELMLLADYDVNSIGQDIEVSISYYLGTGIYTNEVIPVPVDVMTFNPGVKNIVRLEFLGDHLMLSFLPGDSWTLGGDDEIIFD